MTAREAYMKELENIESDAVFIETASDYTNEYLRHGSACDSSNRSKIRIAFVKQAEREIIAEYRDKILIRAAGLCRATKGE